MLGVFLYKDDITHQISPPSEDPDVCWDLV